MSKENNPLKFNLPSVDDIFEPIQGKDTLNVERVIPISIKAISNFPNHPFKVKQDEEMNKMITSIKERGVLSPVLVRPKQDGGYEMISGHRRKFASEIAGKEEIPCIIRNLSDDDATILMVDSNLQREEILYSEKAFAYKMRVEAENRQGSRNDLTLSPMATKLKGKRATEIIGEITGESKDTIYRYIRLTELIPELLQMVDDKKVAFRPAVELSYLMKDEQYVLLDVIQYSEITPSHAQAIHMKKLSQENILSAEKIEDIMAQEKANQVEKVKINADRLEKVLPTSVTTQDQIEDFIIKCIEEHNKRQQNRNLGR